MIDEKKLIDCLKCDISCFETDGMKGKEMYVNVGDIVKMIEGQPKIGGWILCSESNLPEDNVLCRDKHGEIMIGWVLKTEEGGYDAESEHEYMYDCIEWMPLPK